MGDKTRISCNVAGLFAQIPPSTILPRPTQEGRTRLSPNLISPCPPSARSPSDSCLQFSGSAFPQKVTIKNDGTGVFLFVLLDRNSEPSREARKGNKQNRELLTADIHMHYHGELFRVPHNTYL